MNGIKKIEKKKKRVQGAPVTYVMFVFLNTHTPPALPFWGRCEER